MNELTKIKQRILTRIDEERIDVVEGPRDENDNAFMRSYTAIKETPLKKIINEEFDKAFLEALQQQPCELLILKASLLLRQEDLKKWSEIIKREKEEGLIILPSYFEPILIPNDVEIRIEQEPKTEGARGDIPLQQAIPKMPQLSTIERIIKDTIKKYLDKDYDDVTELLLALNKDLCERIRKEC